MQHPIGQREHRRAVRDRDHRHAVVLQSAQRRFERRLAGHVEAGIRLVEQYDRRFAIQRPRQRDTLPLTARQRFAAVADLRFVPFGEREDHVVHVGAARGPNDRLRVERQRLRGAADVLRDRAGEQFDVLRQIAEMRAE